jgi:D-alanyl-D-alanine carboxypeptidase
MALVILLLCALAGCGGADKRDRAASAGPRLTPAIAKDLDAALADKVEATGVPGAVASVVYADGKQWSGAAGDAVVKPRQAMTTDTSLPFDSVTKLAVAALAMRQVEQGRLRLDDPIRRWYPRWRGDEEATVRDLLGHTSGLVDPPRILEDRTYAHPRRAVLAATPRPGPRTTGVEYSNVGFVLAGLILERAAGMPVAVAMRQDVFDHPGGDGLALQPGERPAEPHAYSYWYPHGFAKPVAANDGGPLLPTSGATALSSTAGALAGDVPSLARWAHELLGGHILEPASLKEMTRFHPGQFWQGYGIGLAQDRQDDRVMWGHTGDGWGSHTELWHLPKERVTIAVTWNDDAVERDGQILPELVRAAVGDYQR